MRPTPIRSPRGALAAAVLALAACGRAEPPPVRVSEDAPLPATGADERPPPPDAGPPLSAGGGLATFVASLPARAVVAPRPALPDPAERRRATDPKAFTPRLTGRSAGGKDVIELPLAHTRVVAQVSGNVARVEVTQYYVNPSRDRLEVVYAFPLPPNAAVTDMMFRIGNRVVLSEVKRRDEAKRTYEAAKREGRTAALTEQERPNLFTQSVANVPPGDTVAVVLRYVHEVPFDDGRYLFHFPTTIGPRYVPGAPSSFPLSLGPSPPGGVPNAPGGGPNAAAGGEGLAMGGALATGPGWSPDTDRVPDASRVTPPVVPPGQRSGHDVDVLVRLVPAAAFDDVVARSHRVVTGVDGDGARLVALAEDDRVPNKDLVLSWRPAGAVPAAHALVQREKGDDWLMLFVQPPAEVAPAMVRPKELVFLVDKSGSMMGSPIERAKALVVRALETLGPDDTFQVIAFDGATQAMTAAPVPGAPENVARAKAWLSRLSGGGGTEMLEGIRAALGAPADPRRLRMVVFCTDGFIGDEAEIIEAVGAMRGSARVFGFGIGTSVNRYLVEGVGRAGRGAAEVVDLRESPDEAVARLFRRLDRPVLTDLELSFEGAAVTDLLPARLPDLFAGQPLVVAGRARAGPPSAVILRGRLGAQPWEARLPVMTTQRRAADAAQTEQPVVGTLWARRRIEDLLAARPTAPTTEAIEEVVGHALRFKLVTPYTSFVAVERELRVDPALPLAQAIVPNELPEGVSHEGIFGPATAIEVLPARVKPGDPELRVDAGPSAVAVRVALPFESRPREAIRDARRGDHVLRFLVPPGWPDGSFDARVSIVRAGGMVEERTVPIRVDTRPAAIAVLAAPRAVRPGEEIRLALKPALPVLGLVPAVEHGARARPRWRGLADLAGRPGGLANAVKGAMEVKEVLVRAPWGEVARARMEGPIGVYAAALRVPADAADGRMELEIAASDAAGNVSRRRVALAVRSGPSGAEGRIAYASVAGVAAVAVGFVAALFAAVLLHRRRRARPAVTPFPRRRRSGLDLLTGSGDETRSPLRAPLAIRVIALATLVLAVGAYRERARARHIALPILEDPSLPAAPPAALSEGPSCELVEVARAAGRVTALLVASDGALHVGTFDSGLMRFPSALRHPLSLDQSRPPPLPSPLFDPMGEGGRGGEGSRESGTDDAEVSAIALAGRERFVNALAEHDGLVWTATQGGLVALDGERRAFSLLEGEGVTALARAGSGLYAGTARGVFRISVEGGAEPLGAAGPDGEPLRVTALAASGRFLWIGTPSGAYSLPLVTAEAPLLARTARWHPLVFGEPAAETNVVTALAPLAGGVVAGTDDGGLARIREDGGVSAVRFVEPRANEVNPGAAAARAGDAVFGTQGGGVLVARVGGSGLEVVRLGRGEISAVDVEGGELLAGTAGGAVVAIRCPGGALYGQITDPTGAH